MILNAGQYRDAESGTYYLRPRFYDPATAQFLSRDPISQRTRSPYGYVYGNPLNARHPSGLDCDWTSPWDCVEEHAGDISTVTGILATVTAPIAPLSLGFGAISIVTGGYQTRLSHFTQRRAPMHAGLRGFLTLSAPQVELPKN